MVTISLTKSELFILVQALEGFAIDLKRDVRIVVSSVAIMQKLRKSLRKTTDKFYVSLALDSLKDLIPKKKPLKKGA